MSMKRLVLCCIALGLGSLLSACASGEEVGRSSSDTDCTSHYDAVASASSWRELKVAMLATRGWGRVEALRVQARGQRAAKGALGPEKVVRVVDLLDRRGKRLAQVNVWRTADGWRAGEWSQCID